jgi:putative transposase
MALTRPHRYAFWRYLPHFQREGRPILVNLATRKRWELPPEARDIVFRCCLYEHDRSRVQMHTFVVMPDHVHLLFTPLWDPKGERFSLAEIMNGIKGASAHAVNKLLHRKGPVWEEEFFDHVIRKGTMDAKFQYVIENPVKACLVDDPFDYPWLWVNPEFK